jgi:hypothetical protein
MNDLRKTFCFSELARSVNLGRRLAQIIFRPNDAQHCGRFDGASGVRLAKLVSASPRPRAFENRRGCHRVRCAHRARIRADQAGTLYHFRDVATRWWKPRATSSLSWAPPCHDFVTGRWASWRSQVDHRWQQARAPRRLSLPTATCYRLGMR